VIEGAYGRPWDHGQRLRVLRFMAVHGMNVYVHAPKDDPYQREQWRDPYPAAQMAEFASEVRWAADHGVAWVPSLSPGLPLIPSPSVPAGGPSRDACFSCPADVRAVVAKVAPFAAAGARTFMVSFDDVQKVLTHPEDVGRYGTGDGAYGRANAEFLTNVVRALRGRYGPGVRLLTVPADYSGTSDTDYLRAFRAALDPSVVVMWTGTSVLSRDFDPAEARAYGRAVGRVPIVWDNWTVNDIDGGAVAQPTRIYLGPYRRRADVVGAVGGFLLNPMNDADLNLLPFATAADWMADPSSYDPRASWLRAVRALGAGASDSLRAFAEVNYSTHLDEATEAPTFVAASGAFLGAYRAGGGWVGLRGALDAELLRVDGAEASLAREASLAPFVSEAAPFLAGARVAAGVGRAGSALLAAERPSLLVHTDGGGRVAPPDPAAAAALRAELDRRDQANRSSTRFVYGYRRPATIDTPPTPLPPNRMDVFADAVRALDQDWQPRSAVAASGVALRLDGRPVAVAGDGSFHLAPGAHGILEAADAAGGRTALPVGGTAARAGTRSIAVRRLRGRRLRVTVRCNSPCAGVLRVRAGSRVLASRAVRLRAAGSRRVVLRLRRPLPRRARLSFPGARTRALRLR